MSSEGGRLEKRSEVPGAELRAMAQQMEAQLQGIRRKLRRQLETEFARGEVTGPQRLVMEALVASDGLSVKELSARVSLAHSTVSGIVERLERRGLVERRTEEADRRVTRVRVTKAVREFLEMRAPELTLHPLVAALRRASSAERRAVQSGLDTLERLLNAE